MNPRITVNHVKEHNVIADLHLYCGRGVAPNGQIKANLGNPFTMKDESQRDNVCDAYEKWLESPHAASHIRVIERIIQRINEGKSIALYCHCAPKRCHCNSIREKVLKLIAI